MGESISIRLDQNRNHAALDMRLSQIPTAKTEIPEASLYVGGACSTQAGRTVPTCAICSTSGYTLLPELMKTRVASISLP